MTDQYAVIGNPIAHSKSPLIHEAFARQTGQDISYERILAPLDGFDETVRELIKQGYKGVNVTVPFKFEAFQLANQYSSSALGAGAANTLSFKNQTIAADNTDGAGLVRDIEQNLNVQIAGKRVLLIGAGGAAEGVLQPMFKSKPKSITVVNRTLDKAIGMIKKVEAQSQFGNTILSACTFEGLQGQAFDIVINATSAGLNDTALPIFNTIFAKDCLAYDMMYGRETPFMKLAKDNGAQVADGLGMLVEQAAEAFYIWRGVRPETHSVMQQIRNLSQL
ncbi:shikimate dehydrogenase [Methylotenera sp.]|uniref:shikimate dehydrogenase n=1 Tax=Methylotenera sp. TaxID=2051956 RepID=UPI0027222E4E|nr:shikimate dehydrogenase [Methylotenera sp.]MDO9203852.1 shikimate dehydrogenase [Methylotenera sp.]MDP1524084.1 shikimate dehydrogenase [Methylotenera sp.]MDP3307612.1 shikimate dehydrogenase [Methylotenera sp.]MDP3819605.1 shikimate dehydrogenase [Methylotenera sp.]MDZ4212792.1 shikimate dehydrogenase [Methylotenera sp.]